jgi:ATP-dependent RNA helicase DeaD
VEAEGDFAEIYINVGRRDGARAADFQRVLTERGGIDRADVRRIRVRERNAFVSVRKDDLAKALAALGGASVAGKVAIAEQARERGEGEAQGGEAPAPDAAEAPAVEAPAAVEGGGEGIEDSVPTGRSGS